MGSHQVLNVFPKGVPNSTSLLSHIPCPKFYSCNQYNHAKGWDYNTSMLGPSKAWLFSFVDGPIKDAHHKNKKNPMCVLKWCPGYWGGGRDSNCHGYCDQSINEWSPKINVCHYNRCDQHWKRPTLIGICINASTTNFWATWLTYKLTTMQKQSCLSTHLYTIIYNRYCKKHDDFGWRVLCQTSPWQKIPKEKNTKINDDDIITYTVIAYIVNGIK